MFGLIPTLSGLCFGGAEKGSNTKGEEKRLNHYDFLLRSHYLPEEYLPETQFNAGKLESPFLLL